MPADSLAVIAGRFDAARLLQSLRKLAPEVDRKQPAWELMDRMLRLVGPDMVAYVTPNAPPLPKGPNAPPLGHPVPRVQGGPGGVPVSPPPLGAPSTLGPGGARGGSVGSSLPLNWTIGVRVRPRDLAERLPENLPEKNPSGKQLLESLLPLLIQATNLMREGGSLALLRTATRGDQRLTTVENWWLLPKGAIASYSVTDDYLWAAGSENAVKSASAFDEDHSLSRRSRFRSLVGPALERSGMGEPSQVIYFDLAGWRTLLRDHKSDFAAAAAAAHHVSVEKAQRGVDQLLSLLALADTAVAALRIDDQRIAFSLGLSARP